MLLESFGGASASPFFCVGSTWMKVDIYYFDQCKSFCRDIIALSRFSINLLSHGIRMSLPSSEG
jgi:hypothetical protein